MIPKLNITIMSGVEDGLRLSYNAANHDGQEEKGAWRVSIGRLETSDICLRNDTRVSRQHAYVVWKDAQWWLEDCGSTNGSYLERGYAEVRVKGTVRLTVGQLFRVGHTWMQIEPSETGALG